MLSRVINVEGTGKLLGEGEGNLLKRVDTEQDSYLVYLATPNPVQDSAVKVEI